VTLRGCRNLVLGLLLWFAATGLGAAAAPLEPDTSAGEPEKVLVLLRLAPGHFRAGSDYSDSYGDELARSGRLRIVRRLAREQGLTLITNWPMPVLGVDCFVMSVPAHRSARDVAAIISKDKSVAWAEPMNVFHAQGQGTITYSDPLFPAQPAARSWRLADLHARSTGANVRVAVIDSMVEDTHPDLIGQVQVSRDFVPDHPSGPEQHGTGIAGIIAARGGNGLGIVGVAPGARLMALRACWQAPARARNPVRTSCDTLSLAKALDFAIARNAKVINLSLSGPVDPLLGKLLDVALARGVVVVAAVDETLPSGGFPASHPGVVGAVGESTRLIARGIFVAPGRDVPTTQPGGRWFLVNGSSYAAAHITGLFALLRQQSSGKLDSLDLVTARGGGIDACATLLRVSGPCDCACARPFTHAAAASR
jgi:subtilisin family serine protease